MSYSAMTIANTFLDLAKRDRMPLTNMKLQKLLYFADGHSLSLRNKPLISDEAQAWDYGPVFENVYHYYKHFGASAIPGPAKILFSSKNEKLIDDADDSQFIESIWATYSGTSAIRLSEMSHVPGGPWEQVYKSKERGSVIPKELTKKYFDSLGRD